MKKQSKIAQIELQEIRKNPNIYEVWDEEKERWCDYQDSCYSIKERVAGFPTPDKANQPILAIGCRVLGENSPFIIFGTKSSIVHENFTYVECNNEEHLLKSFQDYWRQVNPDIVTGYNCEGFDIPYLINRCNKLLGEKFTNKFCPFHESTDKGIIPYEIKTQKINSFEIIGISIVDYLPLYKKYSTSTLESYRLDVVAKHELNMGKVDYSEYDGLMGLYEGKLSESAIKANIDNLQIKREIFKRRIAKILKNRNIEIGEKK